MQCLQGFEPELFTSFYSSTTGKPHPKPIQTTGGRTFLATPKVTALARKHFGCPSLLGGPLEDADMKPGEPAAHWEQLLLNVGGVAGACKCAETWLSDFSCCGGNATGILMESAASCWCSRTQCFVSYIWWFWQSLFHCVFDWSDHSMLAFELCSYCPAQHELMQSSVAEDSQRLRMTDFTLSLMEDSGWYQANFAAAQVG